MKTENMAKRLDELLSSVRNLQRYVNVDEDLATFVYGKKALVNKLKNPEFNIVFLGSFSSGKSTLINALLEMELLPESTKATTAVPTFIRFRDNVDADKAATVSFLNVAAINQLRDLYIDEITKQYGLKKLKETLEGKPLNEQITELEKQKTKANQLIKSDTKLFDEFKKLLNGWENKRPDVLIPIEELGNYVAEDNDDILFVDKVDINVKQVKESIDPRIVLVDLPGLGVSNPRHREFTKRVVEETSKAIIVCMKPKHLLEGEEIQLISSISKSHPQILKRAFWIINQWDQLTEEQKTEEEQNLLSKTKSSGIDIDLSRVYKVSALKYLILKYHKDNKLSQTKKLKSHKSYFEDLDNEDVYKKPEISGFVDLQGHLFEFMKNDAENEFNQGIRAEMNDLLYKLSHYLKLPTYNVSSDKLVEAYSAHKKKEKFEEISLGFQKYLENLLIEIRNYLYNGEEFWSDEISKKVIDEVTDTIDKIDRKRFLSKLTSGADILYLPSRFPAVIEQELPLPSIIRREMILIAESGVYKRFNDELLRHLREMNHIPQSVLSHADQLMGFTYMKERLTGLTDALLVHYSNFLDYSVNILPDYNKSNPDKKTEIYKQRIDLSVDTLLDKFKAEIVKYISTDLKSDANRYLRMMLKNYIENIKLDLGTLWQKSAEEIFISVSVAFDTDSSVKNRVVNEYQAIEAYKKSISSLTKEFD